MQPIFSSTKPPATPSAIIAGLEESLLCPVGLDPLTEAVITVPCCHRINEAVAERLYGVMHGGSCEKSGNPCVMCRAPVQAYYVDRGFREIVRQVLGEKVVSSGETNTVHTLVTSVSSRESTVRAPSQLMSSSMSERAIAAPSAFAAGDEVTVAIDQSEDIKRYFAKFSSCSTLRETVQDMAEKGDFAQALRLARTIPYEEVRSSDLRFIAKAMAKQGRYSSALLTAREVSEEERNLTFEDIVKEMAKRGDYVLAQEIAQEISIPESRLYARGDLAREMAVRGDEELALDIVRRIPSRDPRCSSFASIAKEMAKKGHYSQAQEVVRMIDDLLYRSLALENIAEEMAARGDYALAQELLVQGPSDEYSISCRRRKIATGMATRGDYGLARGVAKEILDESVRAFTLKDIVEEMRKRGDSALGQELENQIRELNEVLRAKESLELERESSQWPSDY